MVNYISTAQAAQKWGITANRVYKLIVSGALPEAKKVGNTWMLPESTPKPIDGRTRLAKQKNAGFPDDERFFRYPIFEYRDPDSFDPPLSEEERRLKEASECFLACRFEQADRILGSLPETTSNRYHRITALFTGCMLDIFLGRLDSFLDRYGRLATELKTDFPHRREMQEYIHRIDATLGSGSYFTDEFEIRPDYHYHESFLPHLGALSSILLFFTPDQLTVTKLSAFELNCLLSDKSDCYVDSQTVHLYLGCAYAFLKQTDKMNYHMNIVLELAQKYRLYYAPALQYYYMRRIFTPVLEQFPEDFQNKLTEISSDLHLRYTDFLEKMSVGNRLAMLWSRDYLYIFYAAREYSNKEIADIMKVSVGTVGKRYGEIYNALGVKNKKELIELYNSVC